MQTADARQEMTGTPILLLVDGLAYAYRAFYAIRQLSGPDGSPTNAIYGFVKMLAKMEAGVGPSHRAVVWDGGLDAGRMTAHPEYKAQRPPMPEALERQLPEIDLYLEAAGVAGLREEGVEADDWIGALATAAAAEGARVVIASSDKDFMQLVGPTVGLLNPNDKTERIWSGSEVVAKTGVEPGQVVDWLSLVGDNVDNIPGVPGVGAKTAAVLLREFGSVDALYRRLAEVRPERVRAALEASRETVGRNRELIRLRTEWTREIPWTKLSKGPVAVGRLQALYERWGFRSLREELDRKREQELF